MAPVEESKKEDGRKGNGDALKKYWADHPREPAKPYVPTGKPRGRPSKAEKAKKAAALNKYWAERERVPKKPYVPKEPKEPREPKGPYVPSGKPRGRPKKEAVE